MMTKSLEMKRLLNTSFFLSSNSAKRDNFQILSRVWVLGKENHPTTEGEELDYFFALCASGLLFITN